MTFADGRCSVCRKSWSSVTILRFKNPPRVIEVRTSLSQCIAVVGTLLSAQKHVCQLHRPLAPVLSPFSSLFSLYISLLALVDRQSCAACLHSQHLQPQFVILFTSPQLRPRPKTEFFALCPAATRPGGCPRRTYVKRSSPELLLYRLCCSDILPSYTLRLCRHCPQAHSAEELDEWQQERDREECVLCNVTCPLHVASSAHSSPPLLPQYK